jgi:NADH pyrophosphatase NudC (nudix superfamily)
MRTIVFRVPDRELEALVTLGLDGGPTLAFRPLHGSWGPPIQAKSDSDDIKRPGDGFEFPTRDNTIKVCPMCGHDLAARWDNATKLCRNCGAIVRNVLVAT